MLIFGETMDVNRLYEVNPELADKVIEVFGYFIPPELDDLNDIDTNNKTLYIAYMIALGEYKLVEELYDYFEAMENYEHWQNAL